MKENRAIILLFLSSLIFGLGYSIQGFANGVIPPFYFTAVRMFLGFIILLPVLIKYMVKHKGDKKYFKSVMLGGLACGACTAVPCVIQQIGLAYTTAGKAGFICSLNVLVVPVLSVFLKKKVERKTWLCILLAVVGAYLLCNDGRGSVNRGDLLLFGCAFLFGFQIMVLDYFSKKLEGIDLSCTMFLVAGIICMLISLITEDGKVCQIKDAWLPIVYSGVLTCAAAGSLQITGQKYVEPARAIIPLSLQNAFSAIGGVIILQQYMILKEIIGCAIMFVAVILGQMKFEKRKK